MSARIISGTQIAEKVREELRGRIEALKKGPGVTPGLATVLVGEDSASAVYVSSKQKTCAALGIESFGHHLPKDTSQAEVEALVRKLNADPKVHGILVQLPMPDHIDEEAVLDLIDIEKDVDGFHPLNVGMLAMKGREPAFICCTPNGVMRMLKEADVDLSGAEAVVLGRSNIVGLPMALLLLGANATVTVCHSRTRDMLAHLKRADVVISAIGRAGSVTGDMLKPGAVVIDVGTNHIADASRKSGRRLVGDVDFDSAVEVAGAISPVPGGVGPMTIAMLMSNTVRAAEASVEN